MLYEVITLGGYLLYKGKDMNATVDTIVSLADKARREGLLALEDASKDIDDDFLKDGLQAVITSYSIHYTKLYDTVP